MKTKLIIAAASLATLAFASTAENPKPAKKADSHGAPEGVQDLKIGDRAPDFSLPGIDGRTHTLADYKDAKLLMIAFLSNHCPDSHAAEGRIKQLVADMKGKGFTLVAINPNNPYGLSIDELGYSKWPGAIPHSVLVGTNGEILWRHNGAVNGGELRATVLEKMGRYYQP